MSDPRTGRRPNRTDVARVTLETKDEEAAVDVNRLADAVGERPVREFATVRPTSLGSPQRRIGVAPDSIMAVNLSRTGEDIGLLMKPGRTSKAETPCSASRTANIWTAIERADFDMQ